MKGGENKMTNETPTRTQEPKVRLNISKLEADIVEAEGHLRTANKRISSAGRSLLYAVATPFVDIFGACPLIERYCGRGAEALAEIGIGLGFIYLANEAAKKLVQCESWGYTANVNESTIEHNKKILAGEMPECCIPEKYLAKEITN
jgi:hypothetical protein